ncbi:hypothetical protein CBS101457_000634 [Exobasidium rhododendri]|nr:hypothetical protein CBS101457_000634 [Exobasidium rhododendri]
MTSAVLHCAKGVAAVSLTLGNTFVMTPMWVWVILSHKKASKGEPNGLQRYLTLFARGFMYWMAVCGAQPALNTRTPSKLRDWILCRKFTWIAPASTTLNGKKESFDSSAMPVALKPSEARKRTAGLWYFNPAEPAPRMPLKTTRRSPVVLYFHGGAYITLEAGDIFMGLTLARMQAKYAKVDVLSINYRLAPQAKHPTQLFEAFSSWLYLRSLGYQNIILGGDSAGANIALTLWRYLKEVTDASDTICGLILHSPWLDFDSFKGEAFLSRSPQCSLTRTYPETGLKALQTKDEPSPRDPWLSPLSWSQDTLQALPPLFVSNGGSETLLDEGERFVRLAKQQGVKVEHYVAEGHPHDFAAMFWFAPSIRKLFSRVGAWTETVKATAQL